MVNLDLLLSRLDLIKELPARKHAESFSALCPSHSDRYPSLNVDVKHEGKILLRCRSGCTNADILAAIGLKFRDLYPADGWKRPPGPSVEQIRVARIILELAASDRSMGRKITPKDEVSIQNARQTLRFTRVPGARS